MLSKAASKLSGSPLTYSGIFVLISLRLHAIHPNALWSSPFMSSFVTGPRSPWHQIDHLSTKQSFRWSIDDKEVYSHGACQCNQRLDFGSLTPKASRQRRLCQWILFKYKVMFAIMREVTARALQLWLLTLFLFHVMDWTTAILQCIISVRLPP